MSIHDAYRMWAATYDSDRNLTRDLDAQITRTMIAPLPATAILELGCGTGKNTFFLAERGAPVHALDFSEAMIAQARAKVTGDHVTFTVIDLTRPWPCADRAVDLVVCNLVLEHIADLYFIFAEAARCLAAGGRFFVSELHPFRQYLGGKARFQQEHASVEIPAYVHHVSDFLDAAERSGFALEALKEFWHAEDDPQAAPRLISFLFVRI